MEEDTSEAIRNNNNTENDAKEITEATKSMSATNKTSPQKQNDETKDDTSKEMTDTVVKIFVESSEDEDEDETSQEMMTEDKTTLDDTSEQVLDEPEILETVIATSDFVASEDNQLSFDVGDEIMILQKSTADWWWAELNGCCGYIPVNHVVSQSDSVAQSVLWQDAEYYDSYGKLKLQLEMLNDKPRTLAYQQAIEKNSKYLSGKVVLDLGCGTGVLSMFCVKYGNAEKVYAVEASEAVDYAHKLIEHNKMGDKIEVLIGKMEDVTLPQQVDVIIAEWMGTLLLFEYMIESVILARDMYLKPDGLVWPSGAKLYIVPCTAQQLYTDTMECWGERFGLDFSVLREVAREEFFSTPFHDHVLNESDCLSEAQCFYQMDLMSVAASDLECVESSIEATINKDGLLHGFASWFSVEFGGNKDLEEIVTLNTGPEHQMTHWKQDLLMLDEPITVLKGNRISGTIQMIRNPKWRRHMTITLDLQLMEECTGNKIIYKQFKLWR